MSEEGFRLPGSSYEDLANIIVAYGTRDEASNPGDVSKLDIVHQSSVSRNNAFLTSIGILAGDREKFVTEQGRSLALALARKDRAAIQRKWRDLVSRDEFMQNVLSAVKLREGIFPSTLQAYIAHYAGQPRNKPVMTGALAVIGILKAANLLSEEAGMLVANYDDHPSETLPGDSSPPAAGAGQPGPGSAGEDPRENGREEPGKDAGAEADHQTQLSFSNASAASAVSDDPESSSAGAGGVGGSGVTVHVHVNCAPEELDALAPRIKRLLRELGEDSA
ncbi:hypothetical protein [Rubrobacter aplysinae]|uniref:hypothetical protein n=1 Tax=Rubrobacter aplysinae TaxID=909625 RepID=UPI00064BEA1B|nr:hypothetical protein [Rubrobacter aplysinae]